MNAHTTLQTVVIADGETIEDGEEQGGTSEVEVSIPELFAMGVDTFTVRTEVTGVELTDD